MSTHTSDQIAFDAVSLALLDERTVYIEIAEEALNFMAHVETYWNRCREHGNSSVPAIMARGKLFTAMTKLHKSHLRKRILETRERMEQAAREYTRKFSKGK